MANNICSMCGGSSGSMGPNYAKQVDPPARPYGSFLGDASEEQNYRGRFGQQRGQMQTIQMCLPTVVGKPSPNTGYHAPGQKPSIIHVPCDTAKPCPNFVCEPCPPPPPTKIWLIKSSPVPQKSFAIAQPPPCPPMCLHPIVIPCQPPC